MQTVDVRNHYVVARDSNVLRVDFNRQPDPPGPRFPGAGALRPWRCDEIDRMDSARHRVATAASGASAAR
jgi:hypothetical protein